MKKKQVPKRLKMIEHYYPKFEPNWPVKFSIGLKSKHQAAVLACAFIRVERYLRKGIPKGDFKNMDLADRLRSARRKFQEDSGLVLKQSQIDELARKGAQRIADLQSAKVKGHPEAEFQKSLDEAAANLKKGIASPPITLREFLRRKKGRRHVISPVAASEIRTTLGITQAEMRNVLRAFRAAGIRV
jgi:hypothetical protein